MSSHASVPYRRVYVWELPVRIYHWVNAACVVVLIVTGFIIGRPFALTYSSEAYQQYWFGTVRFVHLTSSGSAMPEVPAVSLIP